MVHVKDITNPLACLFGSLLEGSRNKDNPQNTFIRIFRFFCKVIQCDSNCVTIASQNYNQFNLYGNIGDSMSGQRGILEPISGYRIYGKIRTHNIAFSLQGMPAVCYFDNFETKQKAIKLTQIKALEFKLKNS